MIQTISSFAIMPIEGSVCLVAVGGLGVGPVLLVRDPEESLRGFREYGREVSLSLGYPLTIDAEIQAEIDIEISLGRSLVMQDDDPDADAEEGFDPDIDTETVLRIAGGAQIRCPAYPLECNYIRVTDPDGREVGYWDHTEWEADPKTVIGAFLGLLCDSVNPDP